jgi:putative DNA primase/helicase
MTDAAAAEEAMLDAMEGSGSGAGVDPTPFRQTDAGNALLFVATYKADLRYVEPSRSWMHWNGRRWEKMSDTALLPLARDVTENMLEWAKSLPEDQRTALRKHAIATQKEQRLRAMINLAKGEPEIRAEPSQFDANPWLLGCENVTFDLQKRRPHPPRREDYITKSTGVALDKDAECPNWLAFLDWAFPNDPNTIEHLQRVAGYVLTGSVAEEKLFACFGKGGNGKSTFVMTLLEMLGDYACRGNNDLLLATQGSNGAASPDKVKLQGMRLVVFSETNEGCSLAEAQVKEIVSNEPIDARELHKAPFTFKPTHKVCLLTNHPPFVKGTDDGIWRRLNIVGFKSTMDEGRKDVHFREHHIQPEHPGILAWAVRGCFKWQKDGLRPSKAVVDDTIEYRSEMDFVGRWLEEKTTADEKKSTPRQNAYGDYVGWAQAERAPILSSRRFGAELADRGFPTTKRNGVRIVQGLQLGAAYNQKEAGAPDGQTKSAGQLRVITGGAGEKAT